MTLLRAILYALVALACQGVLAQFGIPSSLIPQLSLLVVVCVAFSERSVQASVAAFGVGFLTDLSSALLLGPWAGAYVTVYAVLALLSPRLFIESGLVAGFVAFFATVGAGAFYSLVSPQSDLTLWQHVLQLLGQALATALCAPWALGLLSFVSQRKHAASMRNVSPASAM